MDEAPEIKGVNEETGEQDESSIKHEDPQDNYDTTHEYMDQEMDPNEHQDDQ